MKPKKQEICIEAINLHCRKLSTGRFITVYSKELGLLKLSGNRLGGRSEPFVKNTYWINFEASSELHTIKSTEFQKHYSHISEDWDKLEFAWSLANILEKCTPNVHDERSREIFSLIEIEMEVLNQETTPLDSWGDFDLRYLLFLWNICELIGIKPQIDREILTNTSTETKLYWDLEEGSLHLEKDSNYFFTFIELLPGIRKGLVLLISETPEKINSQVRKFIIDLLIRYIELQIGSKLKPWKQNKYLLINNQVLPPTP